MTSDEKAIFSRATDTIKTQQRQLENLTAPAYPVGTVLDVYDKSVLVDLNNGLFEVERPNGGDLNWVGHMVQIHPKTGQIVNLAASSARYGAICTVSQIEKDFVVLGAPQGMLVVRYSALREPLSVGDHVVLNHTNQVILRKIKIQSKFSFDSDSPLSWEDVGGCTQAKAELREALETPYQYAALYKFFNQSILKGVALWGRPGNGKTRLARAAAGCIARMHKKESVRSGFMCINGAEILSKWVGEPEQLVRTIFDQGEEHFIEQGYPAIIFFDEADALLTKRGTQTAAGMEQTIVPQFNTCMDGMKQSHSIVLIATNRIDQIDPAILRPGRIDRKCYIGPPTLETAPEIFRIHLRDTPIAPQFSQDQLIEEANKAFFSDAFPLYKLTTDIGERVFNLGHIASGAVITNLVQRAKANAICRNKGVSKPEGLTSKDFQMAVSNLYNEQFGLTHVDELREFIETEKLKVSNLVPYHTVGAHAA